MGALLAPHHRCQQLIAGALRECEDLIDHLIDGLRANWPITLRAVRFTSATEQQAQVVLNLCDGADRGAGIVAGGFLIDRDGR